MKKIALARYLVAIAGVAIAWHISRQSDPALITLIGLLIIVVSTIWLIVSLIRKPQDRGRNVKSWWRLIWDGFWGLG